MKAFLVRLVVTVQILVIHLRKSPLVVKALHTFWQTFLGVWLASGFKTDKVVLSAGLAAGASAVKSLVIGYLEGRKA
jgi:hypothetical protein